MAKTMHSCPDRGTRFAAAILATAFGLSMLVLPPAAADGPVRPEPVWIDTDPACGLRSTDDVDDCWALAQALASPELSVRGISTVFGNVEEAQAFAVAREFLARLQQSPPLHRGAARPIKTADEPPSDAEKALVRQLRHERLTVLALGPVTNIAHVLSRHPALASRIKRVVAVAGKRPGQVFRPGDAYLLHLHDFNVRKDPDAFAAILDAGVPLVLVPFEAANKVTFGAADLLRLAEAGSGVSWLAAHSRAWLRAWVRMFGTQGFHPFDSLAVGYVTMPTLFVCERLPIRLVRRRSLFVTRDTLEVSSAFKGAGQATYCSDVDPGYKERVLARLAAVRHSRGGVGL